jgi:hypothetical protein
MPPRRSLCGLLAVLALTVTACSHDQGHASDLHAGGALDRPAPRIGRGPRYRFPPSNRGVTAGRPVGPLRCGRSHGNRFGVHLEVFANRLDVLIPAGIGVAAPVIREGTYVTGGRCSYPARTREPTGVIEVAGESRLTLGQFVDLWGWPLDRTRALRFRSGRGSRVAAFVNGKRWARDPRAIELRRHIAIVVEVGGYFQPSRRYVFPPGL